MNLKPIKQPPCFGGREGFVQVGNWSCGNRNAYCPRPTGSSLQASWIRCASCL